MTAGRPRLRSVAPVPDAGPGPAPAMSESQLERNIVDLAAWLHLYRYHTRRSEGSNKGFPDWVFVGPGGVLFRELKSDTGTLTPDQAAWCHALAKARADVSVWRPADWHAGRIRRELDVIAKVAEGAGRG